MRRLLLLTILAASALRLWQLTAVPPGLHYDLAATALLGNEVAFNGYRPIFITAYTGHEVLFYYWLALWFRLTGSSVFSLRLAAALLGVLAVPAAYFAVRQATRFTGRGRALGLLSAVLLATAFFHVVFSRFGFRVISQPVMQCLALGCLFRGLHHLEFRPGHPYPILDLILAGLFTGLSAYTYLAARLFPVPLAVFWAAYLWQRPVRSRWLAFGVFTLAAALAFAPLGAYFLQHPDDFLNRAGQVAPRAGEADLLLRGARRALEMIFLSGEPYDRFNIPGRPLFGPVLGAFFGLGLLLVMRSALAAWISGLRAPEAGRRDALRSLLERLGASTRKRPHPLSLPASLMLLAWLPAMLLPTAVSVHDVFPSNVRAFGLIPLIFVFPAWGMMWVMGKIKIPNLKSKIPRAELWLAGGMLVLTTALTAQAYFGTWANLPNQRLNNDADLTAIADYLNAQDLSQTAVYVSAIHYRHPTLAYLARDYARLRWLFGGTSLAFPENQAALIISARSAPLPAEWTAGWQAWRTAEPQPPGQPAPDFEAYLFPAGQAPPLPDFAPLKANFGNLIFLTGQRTQAAAGRLTVDLRWRIENPAQAADLIPYLRLYDAAGQVWAQTRGFQYPSEQWQAGDTLLTRLRLDLPPGLPPGRYLVRAGLYAESVAYDLPHVDLRGRYAGPRADAAWVDLTGNVLSEADPAAAYGLQAPLSAAFAPGLELTGVALPAEARQGERVPLTLFWRSSAALPDAAVIVRLGGAPLLTLTAPVAGYPFSAWPAGAGVAARLVFKVPADFPPGPAPLAVEVTGLGTAQLGMLEITPVARAVALPPGMEPSGAAFGEAIALAGYRVHSGPPLTLEVAWQALAETEADYHVFVHVLDADGNIAAQSDSAPRQGAYPTSLWAAGEIVADAFTFDLPPGEYRLALGFYHPETGRRLILPGSADNALILP